MMKCAIVILRFEHTCYVSKERRGKNRVKKMLIENYIFQIQLLVSLISLILVSFLIYQIWKLPVLEVKLQKQCKHCEITSFWGMFWLIKREKGSYMGYIIHQ